MFQTQVFYTGDSVSVFLGLPFSVNGPLSLESRRLSMSHGHLSLCVLGFPYQILSNLTSAKSGFLHLPNDIFPSPLFKPLLLSLTSPAYASLQPGLPISSLATFFLSYLDG
jgi:hypothetical protein